MIKFFKKTLVVSIGLLVSALAFWAVFGEEARKFDHLKEKALCILELPAGTPSISTTFTISQTIDMFHMGVQLKDNREPITISIAASQGLVAKATTNSSRFGLGRDIPPGTYEITVSQEPGNQGALVVVAGEQPIYTTGWQILSRSYLGLLILSGIWAFVARKSKNAQRRATSLYIFQVLGLCFTSMFFYLLFHEGGHALGEIAFGRYSFTRSDFWGIHGTPHSGGKAGPALKPWQQAVISGGGPMFPTFAGWVLFLLWRSRFGRTWRKTRPLASLYFSSIVAIQLIPGFVVTPCCLLGIIRGDGDWYGFINNVPGPMWLVKGLLWVSFLVSAIILWRLLPDLWRLWTAWHRRLKDECIPRNA